MKQRKIWSVFVLAVLLLAIVSCSKDDEKGNDIVLRPSITVNGKYLIRINSSELEYNAQGLLAKVKTKNTNGTFRETDYVYEAKRIVMSAPDVTYYLEGGRISESRYTVLTSLDEDGLTVDAKDTYEYDRNGNLIKETKPYDFAEEVDMETTVYEWRNGNIQKITRSHYDFFEEITISYTAYPNTIPDVTQGFIGNYLGWQGYYGNRCKNLPESETRYSQNYYPDKTITYHYDYTFEDGVVTKIMVSWVSNGQPSTIIHELEWY